MSEPRYTLAEARRQIQRLECTTHGHAWEVVSRIDQVPVRLICVCGANYRVIGEGDKP